MLKSEKVSEIESQINTLINNHQEIGNYKIRPFISQGSCFSIDILVSWLGNQNQYRIKLDFLFELIRLQDSKERHSQEILEPLLEDLKKMFPEMKIVDYY